MIFQHFSLFAVLMVVVIVFLLSPIGETLETMLVETLVPHKARLLFGGDVMLDRSVRSVGEARGYGFLFEQLRPIFELHDLVVVNLEGPITSHASVSRGSVVGEPNNVRFTFDRDVISALSEHGVVVHVGNNHINDFGRQGVLETLEHVSDGNVRIFGDAGGDIPNHLIVEVRGVTVGLVSFNEFISGSLGRAQETLQTLRPQVDTLVLYAHWGDEYTTSPATRLQNYADHFVDAGADIIIGSHSHVVGEVEYKRGVPIYYSLGNLVFDQYWNSSVRCGALLSIEVSEDSQGVGNLIPVYLDSTRQTVRAHDQCQHILDVAAVR